MNLGLKLAPIFAAAMVYPSHLGYSDTASNLTSNTPPYVGLVTLTEVGTGTNAHVDVNPQLAAGYHFIDSRNDGNHTFLAFDLIDPGAASLTLSSPWQVNAVNPSQNPFGSFTTDLDCCVNKGAPGFPAPLKSTVTDLNGIAFFSVGGYPSTGSGMGDHFISNTNGDGPVGFLASGGAVAGSWLSADLIAPDGATTGLVAARDLVQGGELNLLTTVPEPATLATLGFALVGIGVARRRKPIDHSVAS